MAVRRKKRTSSATSVLLVPPRLVVAWFWPCRDLGPVLLVEDWSLGPDARHPGEVVVRRRGRGRPLERVSVPRIVAGGGAGSQGFEEVDQENQNRQGHDERPHRGHDVEWLPAGAGCVIRVAPRHSVESQLVHREE